MTATPGEWLRQNNIAQEDACEDRFLRLEFAVSQILSLVNEEQYNQFQAIIEDVGVYRKGAQ